MADGDITLSVYLDTSDIRETAGELRDEVADIFNQTSGQKLDSSLQNTLTQMDKLHTKSIDLENELQAIDKANLASLAEEIRATEAGLSEAEKRVEEINQNVNPEGFATATENVEKWREKLAEVKATYAEVENNGSGVLNDPAYEQTATKLNEINNQLTVTITKFNEGYQPADTFRDRIVRAFTEGYEGIVNFNSGTSEVESKLTSLTSLAGSKLVSAFNKVKSSITSAFSGSSITSTVRQIFQMTLGVSTVYSLINKLKNAIKTGVNNLVQYNSETNVTNEAMTQLTSSLNYLKNAWGSAFAPVINYVMPVLTALIDKMAGVANSIATFIGSLTGQEVVINAVKTDAEDYADSLDGTASSASGASKATDKLNNKLASFDDLNVLGKDDDSSSSGGGGGSGSSGASISDMFDYVSTEDWATKIQNAIESGFDFTEVGATIADGLKQALIEVNSHWDEIKETANNIGTAIGTLFNGFFGDTELFSEAGTTLAESLNTVGEAISGFLGSYDVGTVATAIDEFFRSVFTDFDWKLAGENLGGAVQLIFGELATLLKEFPTDELFAGLTEFFESIDWVGVANSVIDFVGSATSFVGDLIGGIGKMIAEISPDDITAFFEGLDWTAIGEGIADLLVGAVTFVLGTAQFIANLGIAIGEAIGNALYDMTLEAGWSPEEILEAPAQAIIDGLLYGIGKALVEAGNWVCDLIITPLVDTFCEMLGINSPSTVFTDYGMDIIQGLINGIADLIPDVLQQFTDLKDDLAQKWEDIKTKAVEKWLALKTSITTKVTELKTSISEKFNAIKDKVTEVAENIRAGALEKFIMLRTSVVEVFNKLGDLIKAPINAIIATVESFVNKIINGINSLTSGFTGITDKLGDVASSVGLPTISISAIPTISIPRLAQGAVIPPNKEFMAVLGDQSRGTNIEAPLDTIKQAVAEELSEQIGVLEEGFASVVQAINNKELAIGDKQIGQASARYNAQQARIRGVNW